MVKIYFPETIISGFRVCGIYPFNPSVILSKISDSSNKEDMSSSTQESHDHGSQSTEAAQLWA